MARKSSQAPPDRAAEEVRAQYHAWRSMRGSVLSFVRNLFSLEEETDYEGTLRQIREASHFRGGNLWALVFAILVASVGLNVNSTAVIIGAMLISPLMGPIMGVGIALAVNDVEQLRRSARHFSVAIVVSVAVSALYFAISPLAEAQSELLSRTRPTLYDVLIAVFGGSAGIVAVSRKEDKGNKGNVIPGVAIATALMPPLCTAGYGLAKLNIGYLTGALYLFFINALFICLATYAFARRYRFAVMAHRDQHLTARIRRIIAIVTVCAVLPSVWVAYNVVRESRFESAARRFVAENLVFSDRDFLNTRVRFRRTGSSISTTVVGRPITAETVSMLRGRLAAYGLDGTALEFRQPVSDRLEAEELGQIVRQGILEDLYSRNEAALAAKDDQIRLLEDELVRLRTSELPLENLAREMGALYPDLRALGAGRHLDLADTTRVAGPLVVASWRRSPTAAVTQRLREFLKARLGIDEVRLVNEVVR